MSRASESREIAREKGLGRIPFFDPRSMRYRMVDFLRPKMGAPDEPLPDEEVLDRGKTLDQGREGSCVGHGWTAWENCKPKGYQRQQGHEYAVDWYHDAQKIDPWPGEDYEGTSTVAGAKVGRERGLLEAWVNASSLEEIKAFIGYKYGPVVMGTPWLESMDHMTDNYYVPVDFSTKVRGGHCWLTFGYLKDGTMVCQNSWGNGYGYGGTFYITEDDFKKLLFHNSDAIGAIQTRVPPR